ncbi:MAG: hypothetical protein M0P57_02405 [Syntrophales bacterium]|nr:hypothetical protein [Syntrophales bacterium]
MFKLIQRGTFESTGPDKMNLNNNSPEALHRLLLRKKALFEEFLTHSLPYMQEPDDLNIEDILQVIEKRNRVISKINETDNQIDAFADCTLPLLTDPQKKDLFHLIESIKEIATNAAELTRKFETPIEYACRSLRNSLLLKKSTKQPYRPSAQTRNRAPRFLDTQL